MTTVDYEACFKTFRGPAEEFFRIVDSASEGAPVEFLRQVQFILPNLQLAVLHLPKVDVDDWEGDPEIPIRSQQEWGALYERLKKVLGPYDLYWKVFDSRKHKDEPVYGSLADDLADIYFDLSEPMKASQSEIPLACIIWNLRLHFYIHWGNHLTSAAKAIYDHLSDIELDIE